MDSTTISNICTQCGSKELDFDSARGNTVCTHCGMVLQDTFIVSDVQFTENAQGGMSAMGQFVSNEVSGGSRPSHPIGSYHPTISRESREITLEKGRRFISEIGHLMKLNQHCIDTGFNWYKMAVSMGITKGRKKSHIVAACLYLVCRSEGTSHMLLDFSDLLQVNVYDLGKAYNHLATKLRIILPTLDPCLYIDRFAYKLHFGDKSHAVSMSALRIVQRMKRDWMAQGRRPSGLCGAALLVAARMHNFNRTVKDVLKVVKISEMTIRKRLSEFEKTPSSSLTIEEFNTIDLEEELDPPCFTEGRLKERQKILEEQGNISELTAEIQRIQKQIEAALEETTKKYNRHVARKRQAPSTEAIQIELDKCDNYIDAESLEKLITNNIDDKSIDKKENSIPNEIIVSKDITSLGLGESIKECLVKESDVITEETFNDGSLDLDGISDTEIDNYLLDDFEIRTKAKLWLAENADYLKQLKEKEKIIKEEREKGLFKDHKKRKRRSKSNTAQPAPTVGIAIEKMLQEKRLSSKINYEVLKDLDKIQPMTDNEMNGLVLNKKVKFEDEIDIKNIKEQMEDEEDIEPEVENDDMKSAVELLGIIGNEDYEYADEYEDD